MNRTQQIIEFIQSNNGGSSAEIFSGASLNISLATLKRTLTVLISENILISSGKGKNTRYHISPMYGLNRPIDMDDYFETEIDDRVIKNGFNSKLIVDILANNSVFTNNEFSKLKELQKKYSENISGLSENDFKNEMERLAIDLSWKSSQIEGNTYSLLETEGLLKDKKTAGGKTKEEAIMLLNHKEAIDFLIENPDFISQLKISTIENIHRILVKDLPIDRNLRKRRVGISGTNYRPLDNQYHIKEALENSCGVINLKEDVFEKALLALVLISYVQPFMDGNKRTSRIVSNAILMNAKHCPLSFRTVDSFDYKKAMLLFYEQNNIRNFKEIFMNQFEFAVNTYF